MEKTKHKRKLLNIGKIFQIIYSNFFLLLLYIQVNQSLAQYFDSLVTGIITDGSLIDISDYYNLSLIITTKKKIYTGIPPLYNIDTESNIISISSAVTYNKKYILMACTENYLLSKISLETGVETILVPYGDFKIPNCTCSISFKDQYAYIGISHIVIPMYKLKKSSYNSGNENNILDQNSQKLETSEILTEINSTNCSDINCAENEDEYYYYYDYINKYLENTVIKIKFTEYDENNEPILDNNFNILNYTFIYKHYELEKIPLSRPFSCEIINIKDMSPEEPRLVCGYVVANETEENKFEYLLNVTVMNSDFDGIDYVKKVDSLKIMPYIRLQRIDNNYIRYIVTKYSYEISLKKEASNYEFEINTPSSFHIFSCSNDLFFYNNYYLFLASSSSMFIKKYSSKNYIKVEDNIIIKKIMGYYMYEGDRLLFIYETYSNQIKYFILENMNFLYNFETQSIIKEVKSNTMTSLNVSELIISPAEHGLLFSFYSLLYYISTTNYNITYDKFTFNKETQMLTVNESLNDWIKFFFYYEGLTNTLSTYFFFENANVIIKTCLFKCGACTSNFSTCDEDTCKANFSLYEDKPEEGCYPNEQNFPNYIHNKTTEVFEKCYETCTFCSLKGELSSKESQNCKVCKEGYLKSYTFMGNCYPIGYPQNTSDYAKVINNSEAETFQIVDNCEDLGKLKINDTGECVDSCPKNTVYHTYFLNKSLNFSMQEESFIGLLYPLKKEEPPQYYFNKVCYSKCPELTYLNKNISQCKCSFGWHHNSTLNESICYDKMDYCLSLNYYFHTDDKECVLDNCKDGYYKINFECYKDECPENSRLISSTLKTCQFNYKYCIIDEHFRNKCSNSAYNEYDFKFNETNIYFQSCNDSILYFNIKTYLYKKTCYQFCPEETIKNDTNDKCSCKYYIYYEDEEKSDYECLKETEKCWDKKKYNITDKKECVKNIEECTGKNYKVFNDECLSLCPENSEENSDNVCLCKNYYYTDNEFLECFDDDKTCETENYPIKMNNTKECFKNKFECIKRGFKFYENKCYESCPVNTIEKSNDGVCSCLYYYYNNSDHLTCFEEDETCESKGYSYTNIDTHECYTSLEICINRGLKIFNGDCYNNCPTDTKIKEDDTSYCVCANYFYIDDNGKLNCFTSDKTCQTESIEYPYISPETKECFKTKEKCINRGLKVFNYDCLLSSCPENTVDKNNNNLCLCSKYSLIDENNLLKCFPSEIECASQGYYFNKGTKECFLSNEECIQNHKKIFGKECVNSCPLNSQIKGNSNICECSYYFYNDDGILNCFSSEKTCENEGYTISSEDTKECFSSINDCYSKNYFYYYENKCYKDSCPSDKNPLNSLDTDTKNAIISALNLDTSIPNILCVCDTTNHYFGWINKDKSNTIIQKCLYQCPTEYDLDETTKKCYYICDAQINFVFNDECYKTRCPEGTKLDPSNPTSRVCVCEDNTKINENSGLIYCEDKYPETYYTDHDKCPYFYKRVCYLKCPEGTCLTTNNKDLAKCIDIRPDMKIYNEICIDRINELLENIEDDDLLPIVTPSGVILNAFSADISMENFIEKYPNLTFVDLGECKNRIINTNNLPLNTKLYIIGIDTPCLYDNSSVNVFNYEIYLKNGTQIKDISCCDDVTITISSIINDLDSVNFYKAIDFYKEGYDIYNRSNIFYVDTCAPAQDNGNDITLVDRAKYYYPNVSVCTDGCIYKVVDFDNKRFICECNADLNDKVYKHEDYNTPKEEEDDSSYFDYFLSLINYKIFLCINLFFEFQSFYYNAGFYISFCTMLICIVLSILFWIFGIKFLKVQIYKNIPTKEKLDELLKKKKNYLSTRRAKKNKNNKTYKGRNEKKYKTVKFTRINNHKSKKNLFNEDKRNILNKKHNKEIIISRRRTMKYSNNIATNLINNNNPPPRTDNILKLNEYLKYRNKMKKENEYEKEEKKFTYFINKNIEIYSGTSENDKNSEKTKRKKNKRNKTHKHESRETKSFLIGAYEKTSSKDKLVKFKNNLNKDKLEADFKFEKGNPKTLYTKREEEIENDNKIKNKNKKKILKSKEINTKKIILNNSTKQIRFEYNFKSIEQINRRNNSEIIRSKYNLKDNESERESSIYIHNKKEMLDDLELIIDFNFDHLIDRNDDDVEKRELNNIPYRQALRIDNRSFFEILFSVLANQIEIISLFLYRNPYSHYTLTISIYLFELLLDLTMNCFLYTDDVVSEKYHNDGNLSMFTSLSLSFISNIFSSIIVFLIAKLTNYPDIIEAIIFNVKDQKKYIENIIRLFKYIKLRLGIFYFLQLSFILVMTYYLFIFCTVYHQSQGSIMVNYIVGACTSLAISAGLTLIISILRTLSIKYHYYQLYNISKYLYEHF